MAKIETTFIRPKELYTPQTGETKVVYDGYQNNPHELVVEENLEGEVSGIVNDTFVPNEGGNVVFTDNNETEHELITEDGFAGALDDALPTALAKAQVIKTTWQELKDKRDNGQLIAGSLYRITDYQCTTTQENTQSAGHQFDIVLLALSGNKLAEEGWAMMHDNIYDVTFEDSGTVSKCYIYYNGSYYNIVRVSDLIGGNITTNITIDEENKTAIIGDDEEVMMTEENLTYNYFQNSNLSAWKVWYCLDNDTARFAWADDRVDGEPAYISITQPVFGEMNLYREKSEDIILNNVHYYAWFVDDPTTILWTLSEIPQTNDKLYYIENDEITEMGFNVDSYTPPTGTQLPNGRGVIYRLIDEWGNDVCYDFKNIQYIRPLTDGEYDPDNGEDTWVYTLSTGFEDSSIPQPDGEGGFQTNSKRNYIGQSQDRTLNNIVAITCNDCDFKACSIITLSYCGGLILSACGGDDSVFSFESNAIYLNNKKVLTEE